MLLFKWLFGLMAVLGLTIGPAIVSGQFTHRWGPPADLSLAAGRLDKLPSEFGTWRLLAESEPLSERISKELGLAGDLGRDYVDRESGAMVGLLLMVGQPGRLIRHPPEICYANRANDRVGDIRNLSLGDSGSEFSLLEFRRESVGLNEHFLVAYGFTDDGKIWKSPESPRMEYGGEAKLYKAQVISISNGGDDQVTQKAIENFLSELVKAFPAVLP